MHHSSKVRLLIWESMLGADLNRRYLAALATRFQSEDRRAKIVIAAASSTAVSGWALWGQPGLNWIWQFFSVTAALVAIALPIWNPAASLKTSSTLSGSWYSIMRDYERLWAQEEHIAEKDALDACKVIQAAEGPLVEQETALPLRGRLARRCQDEVCRSRGLPNG